MSDVNQPKLTKWPFFAGDILLLGAAVLLFNRAGSPIGLGEMALAALCVAGGAMLSIIPYLLEYKLLAKLTEASNLATVVSQLSKIDEVAEQIRGATAQWQGVNGEAAKAAAAAKAVGDKMTDEARAFGEFMQRANDNEKATLRLEVDKLRRAEAEWLHVVVRTLDHIFALHQAGLRSGQATLIEQLSHFQNACCDAARRVGLAPFVAKEDEPFDSQRHQAAEANGAPPPDAVIDQTVASGYTFQGRLIRPALVRLRENGAPGAFSAAADTKASTEGQSKPVQPGDTPAAS